MSLAPLIPMRSISPSRFSGMRNCPLREVWISAKAPELLPSTPSVYVGRITHRLQEDAARDKDLDLESRFDQLVEETEAILELDHLNRRWLPLDSTAGGFADIRRRCIEKARLQAEAPGGNSPSGSGTRRRYGPEVPVRARDGLIVGQIDLVEVRGGKLIITDEKFSEIRSCENGSLTVKKEYEVQLKMYAAMYAEDADISEGRWADILKLRPLYGSELEVSFSHDECTKLLDDAVAVLKEVNSIIESKDTPAAQALLAQPKAKSCTWCGYRPACRAYWSAPHPEDERWPVDLRGQLVDIAWRGNGLLAVSVETEEGLFRVRGFQPENLGAGGPEQLALGRKIEIYSLRRTKSESTFEAGRFSVLSVSD